MTAAYRIIICNKGSKRAKAHSRWFYEKEEVSGELSRLSKTDQEYDYYVEESTAARFQITWWDARNRQSHDEVMLLPSRDPAAGIRERIADRLKHMEFRVYRSFLRAE